MTLRLHYTEYWKERRGACLDKLVLCPLKFKYEEELEIFDGKVKEKSQNTM